MGLGPAGALLDLGRCATPRLGSSSGMDRASGAEQIHMASRRQREWLDNVRIGRDDLIAVIGEQDQGGIDHVAASRLGQQFSRRAGSARSSGRISIPSRALASSAWRGPRPATPG